MIDTTKLLGFRNIDGTLDAADLDAAHNKVGDEQAGVTLAEAMDAAHNKVGGEQPPVTLAQAMDAAHNKVGEELD